MRADQIIKNAKIFTSDKERPMAAALVVKDGKFIMFPQKTPASVGGEMNAVC